MLSACVAALKSIAVLHHNADYIFWFFGVNEFILDCFDYAMLLKDLLEDVNSVTLIITAHDSIKPSVVYSDRV